MKERIVIDENRGLVFHTEDELYDHFLPQIQSLEKEYFQNRSNEDVVEKDFSKYEDLLDQVLDDPDEVWEDATSIHGFKVRTYVGHYTNDMESVYYVALAYATEDTPSFIYLHFPSTDLELVDRFRRGNLLFDRVIKEVENGAVEGDALTEGDDLAVGLYRAMLALRSEKDIPESQFKSYEEHREGAIEDAEEIWRSNDLSGNVLVTFIKDFPDESKRDLHYIVVTIEDTSSSSHALLFSFPTTDLNLVDRYRHGENLQAEEVVQEASH
ncbi:MAG: PBECR2 nuclease fold domain-containing protein [Bdellovibrionota bacterium]